MFLIIINSVRTLKTSATTTSTSSLIRSNSLTQPTKSPILNLNVDLLWPIFLINADMEYDPPIEDRESRKYRALNVVRTTSQVSLHWRSLVLASSSVWAGVVDLELLTLGKDEWRAEVMKRTGRALLSVKGVVSEFFREWRLSLIKDNWSRIRKLDITVTIPARVITRETFDFLFHSTKYLEAFTFRVPLRYDGFSVFDGGPPLFANRAPFMREFHIRHLPFRQEAPWLSQLRRLHLSLYNIFDSHDKLYRVLDKIPFLESLHIVDAVSGLAPDVSRPPILLPHLQELLVQDPDMVGCSIHITSTPNLTVTRHDSRLQGSECLSRYTKNYFDTHHPPSFILKVDPFYFSFSDSQNQSVDIAAWSRSAFEIDIEFHRQTTQLVVPFIFSTIFSYSFSSVTSLDMEIDITDDKRKDSRFLCFLHSFSSVEVLKTNRTTLELLCTTFLDISTVFLQLRVLKMVQLELLQSDPSTRWPSSVLAFFLARRKAECVPVETLDVTLSWDSDVKDLGFLEDISGLWVTWKYGAENGEYLCGSGKSDELDFTNKYTPFLDEEDEI
ncbi:hypothetical protein GALMADRAFT_146169 [Galerina marginata CBS 339.88]|uniref:F-box domain-containing protein n=1 Tax=Galerina marginata (strain CBS 339.88) TaxID=685588 RepID=A0A067SET7_GALM3|nr:hypothetical protein GALMADRAFT_146169 [Galerina marginata CBS 339.88]